MNKEIAIKVIRRAAESLSSRTSRYKYRICDSAVAGSGMLGAADYQPIKGRATVSVEDGILVVQNGRKAEFAAFAISNLTEVPADGDTVKVVPYARRRFDGKYLTDPVDEGVSGSGAFFKTYHLGEQKSRIPNVPENASIYLKQMVEQIECIKAPDARRTIAQMLIDAGASTEPVRMLDTDSNPESCFLPQISFRIDNTRLEGQLSITLDRASDTYVVTVGGYFPDDKTKISEKVDDVYFDDLATVINGLIDDGQWKKDRVEIVKKAKVRKSA